MSYSRIGAASIQLQPGTYFAGFNDSFSVPRSLIISKATTEGFRNFTFGMRDIDKLPAGIVPTSDDWDTWVRADYVGAKRTYALPSAIKWHVFQSMTLPVTPIPPNPLKPSGRTTPKAADSTALLLLVAAFLLFRRR